MDWSQVLCVRNLSCRTEASWTLRTQALDRVLPSLLVPTGAPGVDKALIDRGGVVGKAGEMAVTMHGSVLLRFLTEINQKATLYLLSLFFSAKSCPILFRPVDCSLPVPSVPGISQTRILEWVAFPFSRESSQPRDRTQISNLQADFLPADPCSVSRSAVSDSLRPHGL